ncbi:MAG: hypothetical protein AAFQ81_03410 [Pseudomonadota bacterium]
MQRRLLPILIALLFAAGLPWVPAEGQTTGGAGAAASGETQSEALRGVVTRRPALPAGAVAGGASQGSAPLSTPSSVASSLEGIRA